MVGQGNLAVLQKAQGIAGGRRRVLTNLISAQSLHPTAAGTDQPGFSPPLTVLFGVGGQARQAQGEPASACKLPHRGFPRATTGLPQVIGPLHPKPGFRCRAERLR